MPKRQSATDKKITKMVKRELTKRTEDKILYTTPTQNDPGGGAVDNFDAQTIWIWKSFLVTDTTGGITGIPGIIQGIQSNQRTGNDIFVRYIDVTVRVTPKTMDTNGSTCRLVALHHLKPNGGTVASTGVFNQDQFNSVRNIAQKFKYKVLKDFVHSFVTTVSTNGGPEYLYQFRIPVNKKVRFNSAAASAGDLISDDYLVGFCADSAACCTVTVKGAVVYTDA